MIPDRCSISRSWMNSMISAQVCFVLITSKVPLKMCMFITQHYATDYACFEHVACWEWWPLNWMLISLKQVFSNVLAKRVNIWCDHHLPQVLRWSFLEANLPLTQNFTSSVAFCCMIKLHSSKWPFSLSPKHTLIMFNERLDMPPLCGRWLYFCWVKNTYKFIFFNVTWFP